MTSEEKAALREAAEKATKEEWWDAPTLREDCGVGFRDARYIALANPAAVLALLDECERMREALSALLEDSEPVDFGEWLEARMKQARAALEPRA
jgi:hypothetical protein